MRHHYFACGSSDSGTWTDLKRQWSQWKSNKLISDLTVGDLTSVENRIIGLVLEFNQYLPQSLCSCTCSRNFVDFHGIQGTGMRQLNSLVCTHSTVGNVFRNVKRSLFINWFLFNWFQDLILATNDVVCPSYITSGIPGASGCFGMLGMLLMLEKEEEGS